MMKVVEVVSRYVRFLFLFQSFLFNALTRVFFMPCEQCATGHYLPEIQRGRTSCLVCEGVFEQGSAVCPGCEAGKYGVDPNCVYCAVGFFNPGGNKVACLECNPGYHSDGQNSSSECTACISGMYSNKFAALNETTCTPCIAGKFGKGDGLRFEAEGCQSCQQGYWSGVVVSFFF